MEPLTASNPVFLFLLKNKQDLCSRFLKFFSNYNDDWEKKSRTIKILSECSFSICFCFNLNGCYIISNLQTKFWLYFVVKMFSTGEDWKRLTDSTDLLKMLLECFQVCRIGSSSNSLVQYEKHIHHLLSVKTIIDFFATLQHISMECKPLKCVLSYQSQFKTMKFYWG